MWLVAPFVMSALVALAGCSAPAANPSIASTDAAADRAGTVDVGGDRTIYLKCHGTGSPTVVLVSGLGDSAETWSTGGEDASPQTPTVYDGVADFTRVCAYDRPGTTDSRSSEVPQPTSAQVSADDLQKLLVASGEEGPFVFAGHSYGGPIIRLFAGDHPDDVAGLVLVDALSEDLGAGLTPAQTALFETLNAPPPQSRAESFDYNGLVTELRHHRAGRTRDRPHRRPAAADPGAPGVGAAARRASTRRSRMPCGPLRWPHRTCFPPSSRTRCTSPRTRSDHYVHLGNPQLVIDSIRDVVNQARSYEPPCRRARASRAPPGRRL